MDAYDMMDRIRELHAAHLRGAAVVPERNKLLTRLRKASPAHWAGLVHELARETEAAR